MAIWCQLSKLSKSTGQWTFFPGLTTQLDGYRITLIISDPCRWIFIAYFFMVPCWSEYPTDCLVDMSTCDFGALTSRTSAETQPKKSSVLVGSRCSSSHAKTILATCLWCELQRYRILIRNSAATDVFVSIFWCFFHRRKKAAPGAPDRAGARTSRQQLNASHLGAGLRKKFLNTYIALRDTLNDYVWLCGSVSKPIVPL